MANKIVLISLSGRYDEGVASEAILPGSLVERDPAGGGKVRKCRKASTVKALAQFATEDALQGGTVQGANYYKTGMYPAGEQMGFHITCPGDIVQARAAAAAYVAGDQLASAGDGTLKKASAGDVAIAEVVDATTVNAAPDNFLKVQTL